VYGTLSTTQYRENSKKASELTFNRPKQEKPDIWSTNLTQDEPVLCFNEDSFRQSLEMCQPSAGRKSDLGGGETYTTYHIKFGDVFCLKKCI